MFGVGSPQFLFMAEAEGRDDLVDTRQAKLNAAIKDLRGKTHINTDMIERACYRHNLMHLSSDDFAYIRKRL